MVRLLAAAELYQALAPNDQLLGWLTFFAAQSLSKFLRRAWRAKGPKSLFDVGWDVHTVYSAVSYVVLEDLPEQIDRRRTFDPAPGITLADAHDALRTRLGLGRYFEFLMRIEHWTEALKKEIHNGGAKLAEICP